MKKLIALLFITLPLLNSCRFAEAPALGLAKEICSCLFISEQPIEYCKMFSKESEMLASFRVNWVEKEVYAKGMGHRATAKLQKNARLGCVITSLDSKK